MLYFYSAEASSVHSESAVALLLLLHYIFACQAVDDYQYMNDNCIIISPLSYFLIVNFYKIND